MARRRRKCKCGIVKSGPRKGLCRKVCKRRGGNLGATGSPRRSRRPSYKGVIARTWLSPPPPRRRRR